MNYREPVRRILETIEKNSRISNLKRNKHNKEAHPNLIRPVVVFLGSKDEGDEGGGIRVSGLDDKDEQDVASYEPREQEPGKCGIANHWEGQVSKHLS